MADSKHPSSGHPTKIENEDFTASMARLAELATKEIVEKPDRIKTTEEQVHGLQYLTPKRKVADLDTAHDPKVLRVNPYVIVGILVVLLSCGFLAIPRIVAFVDSNPLSEEEIAAKQRAQASAKGDTKQGNYSLANVVQDMAQRGELKTATSIADLAKQIADTNAELGLDGSIWGSFSFDHATLEEAQISDEPDLIVETMLTDEEFTWEVPVFSAASKCPTEEAIAASADTDLFFQSVAARFLSADCEY